MMSDFRVGWGGQGKSDYIGQGRGVDKQKSDVLYYCGIFDTFFNEFKTFFKV